MSKRIATEQELSEIRKLHAWMRTKLGLEPFPEEIRTLHDKWAPIDVTSVLLDHIDALRVEGSKEK